MVYITKNENSFNNNYKMPGNMFIKFPLLRIKTRYNLELN